MKRAGYALAVLLALGRAAPAAEPGALQSTSAPVYTRQGVFSIPFRIDGLDPTGPQPTEVRLSVSEDQGVKWRTEARVKPDQQSFGFRAPHDGEYWFSIRTIDRGGREHPEGPHEPQLQVIVDTITPRLDLSAERGAGGEVIARWHVLDTGLKADSLKLEFQTPGGEWQPLPIEAQLQRSGKYTLIGEATWSPPSTGGAILLRASVSDEAGNTAVSQAQVKTERSGRGDSPRSDSPGGATHGAGERFTNRGGNTSGAGSNNMAGGNNSAGGKTYEWPADTSTGQTLANAQPRLGDTSGDRPPAQEPLWRSGGRDTAGESGLAPGSARVPAQTVSQVQTQPAQNPPADWSLLPIGERPRMVNGRTFEIDYEIDAVGSSGVSKVELWGTRDGGRHWANFGADNDNRSPLAVTVDGEGVFGFRVVIQSGNGLAGQTPRDGDLPEVWIGVDLTKPQARITAIELGSEGGEITLRWETSDALLDPRPVALFYSDQPRGPWTSIASELESSGSFVWRLDSRVPPRTFIRLEARDEAGNVGVYDTPDPVSIDRQRPQGRIRGVRPVGQPGR